MGALIAGEGGSVLVAASQRNERPALLAAEGLAAASRINGVSCIPIESLPADAHGIDRVELTAAEPRTAEAVRAWAEAHGLEVRRAAPAVVHADVPVIAVSAPSTGSGKTAVTRKISRSLRRSGVDVSVVRHPLAGLSLWDGRQGAEVVASPEHLSRPRPLEEREELAPVVGAGVPVVSGCDPAALLAAASGRVVVWDGGGAALPWIRPDLHLVVVDLLRPFPPGADEHLRTADVIVLNKANAAGSHRTDETEARVRELRPDAAVVLTDMPIAVPEGPRLVGRNVVVVEDWPSLVLGGLKAGAGAIAAKRFRAGVVDPRPFAVGAIADVLRHQTHIGPVIPSLGRTPQEQADLAASVAATPGDAVLWASPASPAEVLAPETRPILRVYADLQELAGVALQDVIRPLLPGHA